MSNRYEILEKVSHGEAVPRFETVHPNKNGTAIDVSLSVSSVRDPRAELLAQRLGLIQDLTAALQQSASSAKAG